MKKYSSNFLAILLLISIFLPSSFMYAAGKKTENVGKKSSASNNTWSATCSNSGALAYIGDPVYWVAYITSDSSASRSFQYEWSGTDSLSGNLNTVTKKYETAGTKSATVTIRRGYESLTVPCGSIEIKQSLTPLRIISPQSGFFDQGSTMNILWEAKRAEKLKISLVKNDSLERVIASNINNTGSYAWTIPYNVPPGIYQLRLSNQWDESQTVIGNSIFIVEIQNEAQAKPLSASCQPSTSYSKRNSPVSWTAYPSGGNGTYSYFWSGTGDLFGRGNTVSKQYESNGMKSARVTVTSGNKSITVQCFPVVTISSRP